VRNYDEHRGYAFADKREYDMKDTCVNCDYRRETDKFPFCPKCGESQWVVGDEDNRTAVILDVEDTYRIVFMDMVVSRSPTFTEWTVDDQCEDLWDEDGFTFTVERLSNNAPTEDYPFMCSNCSVVAATDDLDCPECDYNDWERRTPVELKTTDFEACVDTLCASDDPDEIHEAFVKGAGMIMKAGVPDA